MVFKKGTPSVLSFKKLGKYRHTTVFKYCMIEHVYAYLVNTSLAKTAIFFQTFTSFSCLQLLIRMFGVQYWKNNKICNIFKNKEEKNLLLGNFDAPS